MLVCLEMIKHILKSDVLTVTELMSPKAKPNQPSSPQKPRQTFFPGADGLAAYTVDPTAFPKDRVIYHNDSFVMINDLFPKASVHCLILPRDESKNVLHPFDAFEDPVFLAQVREEVVKAKAIVASELRRRYGKFSMTERPRLEAMESDDPPEKLPEGRDWSKGIMAGIHAHPSMNHLHVHVMSRDMVSDAMKHRRHYINFNTPFLVELERFPLAEDDPRRHPGRSGYIDGDLICWRCGQNYGNKFTKLKRHLEEEFEAWKRD